MSSIYLLCSLLLFNYAVQGMEIERLAIFCENLSQTRRLVCPDQSSFLNSTTQQRLLAALLEAEIEASQQVVNECTQFVQSAACDQSKNACNARGYFESQARAYARKITQLEKEKVDAVRTPAPSQEHAATLISAKQADQIAAMPEASYNSFL